MVVGHGVEWWNGGMEGWLSFCGMVEYTRIGAKPPCWERPSCRSIRCGIWRPARLGKQGSVLSRYTSVGQGLRRRDQWTTARQCLRPRRDDHSSGRCQSLLSSLAAAARGPRTSPPRRRVLQPCPRLLTTAKPCGNFAGACRRGRRRHCVQRLTLMGGRRKKPSHADLVHGNSLLRWIRMRQRMP